MFKKFLKLLTALFIFSIIIFFFSKVMDITSEDEIIICIDPGHGGIPEYGNRNGGDSWYEPKKTFLNYYNYGGIYEGIKEHEYVYDLAVLIKKNIEDLNSDTGYEKMVGFLKKHNISLKTGNQKKFKVFLSRDKSAETINLNGDNINRFYRTFDSPHKDIMFKGKLSRINEKTPDYTLSLHLNYVESEDYQGMLSFFAPSVDVFDRILKNRDNKEFLKNDEYYSKWNIRSKNYAIEGFMVNDANTYFTGIKNDGRFIGKRNEMITWKYKDEKSFAVRENSVSEKMRRNGGYEGIGGDNLYFSNEILRYVSYFLQSEKNIEYNILEERASDWSVCIFNNSITAGLELGNLYSSHDRKILVKNRDSIAEYIAYAVYCINTGIHKTEDNIQKIMPYGKEIKLKKYGDYFKECAE